MKEPGEHLIHPTPQSLYICVTVGLSIFLFLSPPLCVRLSGIDLTLSVSLFPLRSNTDYFYLFLLGFYYYLHWCIYTVRITIGSSSVLHVGATLPVLQILEIKKMSKPRQSVCSALPPSLPLPSVSVCLSFSVCMSVCMHIYFFM